MKYVALLRGINVGGKHILPMKDLTAIFEKAGCADVCTYIQSGNVVFSAPASLVKELPEKIAAAIEKRFGFRSPVILRSAPQMRQVLSGNPFLTEGADEKMLHVMFLAAAPTTDPLDPQRSPPDRFELRGKEIYLHILNHFAKTKLSNAYFDAKLGTVSTARNWATVRKLCEMLA